LGQIFVTELFYPNDRFNPIGPDAVSNEAGETLRWDTTVKVTDDFDLRAGYSWSERRHNQWDHNTFRPVAGLIPGEFIADSRFNVLRELSRNKTAKLEASYRLDLGVISQYFVVGASALENETFASNVNGPLRPWNPLKEAIRSGYAEVYSLFPNGLPQTPVPAKSKTRSYYISDQIQMLDDRLHAVLGARSTDAENAAGITQKEVTPQFGLLFRPIEGIGLFANYSETFEPNYLIDGKGNQVGPTTGKGTDFGMKFDVLEGKLSATTSVFSVERANIPRRDVPVEIATGISPIFVLGGLERTQGLELDVIYTPVRNVQLIGSYAYTWERETVESTGDIRQVGVLLDNVPEHVLNFWGKYTFTEGRLKNLSVGVGTNYNSGSHLHPSWDVPLIGEGFFTIDAMLGYEFRVTDRVLNLQLNVRNVTNELYNPGVFLRSNPTTAYLSARLAF
jgi:outer membrane receptor protein involved in Fe transport